MKKALLFTGFILLTLVGSCQPDKTFTNTITCSGGIISTYIQFPDGSKFTTATGFGGTVSWTTITGKPTFATVAISGSYTDLLNKPNFDLLYKPITYVPDWTEIKNKPPEQQLLTALGALAWHELPPYTTAQINALVIPAGKVVEVWDKDLKCKKVWDGTMWKIYITGQ